MAPPLSHPDLHPDLQPIAFLIGTWAGRGAGEYPTIESFEYFEEITIGHAGKPFLSYAQKTKHAETGLPLHAEAGYFRPSGANAVELVIAQPSGIVEVLEGTLNRQSLDLIANLVGLTSSAKSVTEVHRQIQVEGDTLSYQVAMAAVGLPLQHHLAADLHRKPE